jgi:hypothetical protein
MDGKVLQGYRRQHRLFMNVPVQPDGTIGIGDGHTGGRTTRTP